MNYAALNNDSTLFYEGVIQPLFEKKCTSCHGADKQKGKLRLDSREALLKGGKSGETIVGGKPNDSELIYRIFLPEEDEDHMPPKEKPRLTSMEMELLRLWVEKGADFEKTMTAMLTAEERRILFDSPQERSDQISDVPQERVPLPDFPKISALNEKGIAITPLAEGNPYLSVNFVSVPALVSTLFPELMSFKENITWLKLSGCEISANELRLLEGFKHLTRLSLDDTAVGDSELSLLKELYTLQYLNLKGTSVTEEGIKQLAGLPNLKELYLYQTKVSQSGQANLQALFPTAHVDFGEYEVSTLVSDTTEVKQGRK